MTGKTRYQSEQVEALLRSNTTATMSEFMGILNTSSRRTVARKLKEVGALSSYSDNSRHYTLPETPEWDANGLWWHAGIRFSRQGTLIGAVRELVASSRSGYFTNELDDILGVSTKTVLKQLHDSGDVSRSELGGCFFYLSSDATVAKGQMVARKACVSSSKNKKDTPAPADTQIGSGLLPVIALFFSLLDEQQRRLYAGLESLKIGYGGDVQMAELLGVHVTTVARGRKELLSGDVLRGRARVEGGGRKAVEKKRLK